MRLNIWMDWIAIHYSTVSFIVTNVNANNQNFMKLWGKSQVLLLLINHISRSFFSATVGHVWDSIESRGSQIQYVYVLKYGRNE